MKNRIMVDLDGVLCDVIPPFIEKFRGYFPRVPAGFTPDHWYWYKDFDISKEEFHAAQTTIFTDVDNFWLNLPQIDHECDVLAEYMRKYPLVEFFFVTSRPKSENPQVSTLRQTNQWLANYKLVTYNSTVVMCEAAHHKAKMCDKMNIEVGLDDRYDTVSDRPKLFNLRLQPWNEKLYVEKPDHVKAFANISEWLKEVLD